MRRLPRYLINVRHGFGSARGLLKDVYSGKWSAGFRHGNGIEIGLNGRYQGHYEYNVRKGKGTLDFPNGDRCVVCIAYQVRRLTARSTHTHTHTHTHTGGRVRWGLVLKALAQSTGMRG